MALVAHIVTGDERVAGLPGLSDGKRSWSRGRSCMHDHANRQHEQSKSNETGDSRLELHDDESGCRRLKS